VYLPIDGYRSHRNPLYTSASVSESNPSSALPVKDTDIKSQNISDPTSVPSLVCNRFSLLFCRCIPRALDVAYSSVSSLNYRSRKRRAIPGEPISSSKYSFRFPTKFLRLLKADVIKLLKKEGFYLSI
jgi:hypothetical protein